MLPKFSIKEHSAALSMFVKFADLLLYLAAALLAYDVRFGSFKPDFFYQIALFLIIVLTTPVFTFCGVYQSLRGKSFFHYLRSLYLSLFVLAVVLAAIASITKTGDYFSRQWFLLWNLYALVLLTLFRVGLKQILHLMRKHGRNQRQIIIIGSGAMVKNLVRRIHDAIWTGFKLVAVFDKAASQENLLQGLEGEAICTQMLPDNLEEYIEEQQVAEVWLVLSAWEKEQIEQLLSKIHFSVVTIRYFPNIVGIETLNQSISEILGLPVINVVASPMTGKNRIIKAIEDRVLAGLILLLVSPILLVIAILVKLSSSGSVFYRQLRHGWDGKPICVYKFRTMFEHQETEGTVTQARKDDVRITKIGKFLRKTSLDELPQFINVLQGRMSIVGPRPHAIEHNEYYRELIDSYMQRHHVKPGITGWAQVNGWRGETDTLDKMQKRVEYDLYYINHWSFWFDIKIIFMTIFVAFFDKNAY